MLDSRGATQQLWCTGCRPVSCRRVQLASVDANRVNGSTNEGNASQQRPTRQGALSGVLSQAPELQAPAQVSGTRIANFRFWHDEKRFRGSGEVWLAQHMLFAAGGTRMGGNFKEAHAQGYMGWQQPHKWDILWSTSDGNMKAAHLVKPGQLLSGLPGMECVTKKRHLAVTLQAAYGESAWQMLPRTYSIPAQLLDWRQRLADEAAAATAAAGGLAAPAAQQADGSNSCAAAGLSSGYWVLKTGAHLGQGLKIVPANKALSTLLERNKPYLSPPHSAAAQQPFSNSSSSGTSQLPAATPRAFICVQQYITNPLLINKQKFGLRLWVLVIGPAPFRAYLYSKGLVLFSGEQYNADMQQVESEGADTQGHLTNHAQNQSADVWALHKLFGLLGPQQSEQLWQQLSSTAGRVVAAAAGHVRTAAQELKLPEECAFELLGLDFLLDGSLTPWLLEVNASPSMAWQHSDEHTATLMKQIKQELLSDMMCLLRLQDRYPAADNEQQQQKQPDTQQRHQAAPQQHSGHAAAAEWQQDVGGACQVAGSTHSTRSDSSSQHRQTDQAVNQILLQAASAKYFKDRPLLQQLVHDAAQLLHAAVAVSPYQQQAQQCVQHLLSTLQPGQQQEGLTPQHAPLECGRDSRGQAQRVGCGGTAYRQDALELLCKHADKLVQLEAEFRSSGQWESLLDHMPVLQTSSQHADVDAAMREYCKLRAGHVEPA